MEPADVVSTKTVNISSARRGLGRGLDALLPTRFGASSPSSGETVQHIGISAITPNPHQPRQQFHPQRLQELAESIKAHGIVQPVVVRKQGEKYMLIAGERRWRAASLAGLATIPAIVRDAADSQMLEITLIENIQREELNPVEVAEAFQRLSSEANLTHEQIAERTGKDRVTVTNYLRLLRLPSEVRSKIASGELSMGHAKVLMGLDSAESQKALAARILAQALSVRQTEAAVREQQRLKPRGGASSLEKQDPNIQSAIRELERALGARVRVVGNSRRGKIVIEYHSAEDLDRIYTTLLGRS